MPSLLADIGLFAGGGEDHPRMSAYALGVYQECPRKYALRYRQNLYWPAPDGKPQDADTEKRDASLERGQRFHALVHAHQEGLPLDAILAAMAEEDPATIPLWEAYLAHADSRPEGEVRSEVALHFFVKDVPVMARFDRLVQSEKGWLIQDWKTGGSLESLANSWQTKLYPFALAHAGHALNGGEPIPPEAIRLRYWLWKDGRVETGDWEYSSTLYAEHLAEFERQAGILSAPLNAENFPGHGAGSRACGRCQFMTLCHPMPLPEPPRLELPLPRFSGPDGTLSPLNGGTGRAEGGVSRRSHGVPRDEEPRSSETPEDET